MENRRVVVTTPGPVEPQPRDSPAQPRIARLQMMREQQQQQQQQVGAANVVGPMSFHVMCDHDPLQQQQQQQQRHHNTLLQHQQQTVLLARQSSSALKRSIRKAKMLEKQQQRATSRCASKNKSPKKVTKTSSVELLNGIYCTTTSHPLPLPSSNSHCEQGTAAVTVAAVSFVLHLLCISLRTIPSSKIFFLWVMGCNHQQVPNSGTGLICIHSSSFHKVQLMMGSS